MVLLIIVILLFLSGMGPSSSSCNFNAASMKLRLGSNPYINGGCNGVSEIALSCDSHSLMAMQCEFLIHYEQ